MKNQITIDDINKFDKLDTDTIIEASAGTGKTYSIEQLVVKVLCQRPEVNLENILLITFTEKAAGELKDRIREKIRNELFNVGHDTKTLQKLDDSLKQFDDASIYTIHGFCYRILQQYAFENGQPFTFEIKDNSQIYEMMLYQIKSKKWHNYYGTDLKEILSLINYNESIDNIILSIAKSYIKDKSVILPENFDSNPYKKLCDDINQIFVSVNKLKKSINFNELLEKYKKVHIKNNNKIRGKILEPFLQFADRNKPITLSEYDEFISNIFNRKDGSISKFGELLVEEGFDLLASEKPIDYKKNKPVNIGIVPEINKIILYLNKLVYGKEYESIKNSIIVSTIYWLRQEVQEYKSGYSYITYDDMLNLVLQALQTDKTDLLKNMLRKKYRYAFIDEFQDTDPVQWEIFRTIFYESANNRLFIIGDPKQAIYGFRGGDIYTYINAKNKIIDTGQALTLNVNWRSCQDLITAFNEYFVSTEWFANNEFVYTKVNSPKMCNAIITKDNSERSPLNIISFKDNEKVKYSKFIASEIFRLLYKQDKSFEYSIDGTDPTGIKADDICILISARKESRAIELALDELNIPHSFYKKEGLYQSEEALNIRYLLESIAYPDNIQNYKRALLTEFFSIDMAEINLYENIPFNHKIKVMFNKWVELSIQKDWAALFNAIKNDTGVYLKIANRQSVNWERKITNYEHIFQNLIETAYSLNLDILELQKCIKDYENKLNVGTEEMNLHRLETEKPKVQIMTMHASKGLEFPIVFVCGNLDKKPHYDYCKYHLKKKNTGEYVLVYNLSKKTDVVAQKLHEIEAMEETKRLFYVAITRAVFKCYIPDYNVPNMHKIKFNDKTIKKIDYDKKLLIDVTTVNDTDIIEKNDIDKQDYILPELISDKYRIELSYRDIQVSSYTNIVKNIHYDTSFFDNDKEIKNIDDNVEKVVKDTKTEISQSSKYFGLMFHEIMENLNDFTIVNKYKNVDCFMEDEILEPIVTESFYKNLDDKHRNILDDDYELKKSFLYELYKMIFNSLKTPLDNDKLILGNITEKNKLVEKEFYYPFMFKEHKPKYIKGYIDMIFRDDNKYYILDWKTNYIESGYSSEKLKQKMEEADYILQYRIYLIAVYRWLKKVVPDFSLNNIGGVYYLFVRGLNGKDNTEGVYYYKPDSEKMIENLSL